MNEIYEKNEKNENKKCKIIGYGKYTDKENGQLMLRILVCIDSNKDNYYGKMIPPALFFECNDDLDNHLKKAIDNEDYVYYESTDDIITNSSKICKLIF